MANETTSFWSELKLAVAVLKPMNVVFQYRDGSDKPPTGFTAYDISSFDDKPIVALLKKSGPLGWLSIITKDVSPSKDKSGNPIYDMVLQDDGSTTMEPRTRPPHIYIGIGGGSLDQLEDMFGHLA